MAKLKIQTNTVGVIAESISEIAKLVRLWIGSTDQRRMAKAIRLGDRIVKKINELEVDNDKLKKMCKKWDKYNN